VELYENGLGTSPASRIQRLWPELAMPWKRKDPTAYAAVLTRLLRDKGYVWRDDVVLQVEPVDAMICGIAAPACLAGDGLPEGTVGGPKLDTAHSVLREGYVVSP